MSCTNCGQILHLAYYSANFSCLEGPIPTLSHQILPGSTVVLTPLAFAKPSVGVLMRLASHSCNSPLLKASLRGLKHPISPPGIYQGQTRSHSPSHSPLAVMTSTAPRVTIAKPSRSNGVLSIPASATQKKSGGGTEAPASRAPLARLKIIIRRLPPGLTQSELDEALGDEWRTGGDKVDWAVYKEGKVSKEYGRASRDLLFRDCTNTFLSVLQNPPDRLGHTCTLQSKST